MIQEKLALVLLDGYIIGKLNARNESAIAATERGDYVEAARIKQQPVMVRASAEKAIFDTAGIEADAWIAEVEARCKQALVNHLAAPAYDAAAVRLQLYAAIMKDIESPREPAADQFARRGRPMKVRDAEQHRKWQLRTGVKSRAARMERLLNDVEDKARANARDMSLSPEERAKAKRVYREIAEGRKEGKYPKRLNQAAVKAKIATTRARTTNKAIVDAAIEDETVVMLQYTTARDAKVCEAICRPHDGWTVKKDDPAVSNFSPPLHPRCRCRWMHVHEDDAKKLKIKPTERPDVEPAAGFGGGVK